MVEVDSRTLRIAAIVLLATMPAAAADQRWIRIISPGFEMSTTSSEGSARDTVRYFEQVRAFFLEAFGEQPGKKMPVSIVAFHSDKEFDPYRPREFAAAFFHPGADRDYIVMSHTGEEQFRTAVHEYVHLLVHQSGSRLAPWFNEGLAELFSTLKPEGSKVLVGTPPAGRVMAMRQQKWVPLAEIVSADHNSPYYNEKQKAGSLYNEGWALTHMLYLTKEYRPGFSKFLQAMNAQKSCEQALMEVYGKPLSKVDGEVQAYVRQETVTGAVFPVKFQKNTDTLDIQPLPVFEAKLRLADILFQPGKEEQARKMAEELIAEQPSVPSLT